MKLMFVSDIHGSVHWLDKAIEAFEQEAADHLVILGDMLYHGPRNPLPEGYLPAETAVKLNVMADRIIAIQGNCESEVDQMVLDFPVLVKHSNLLVDGRRFFLTHGHEYNSANMPKLPEGSVVCHGHTHIPVIEQVEGAWAFNPGSVGLPKNNTPNSYGIYENGVIRVKDFNGGIYLEQKI